MRRGVTNMPLKLLKTNLDDVLIFEPQRFEDERGFFMETYHEQKYSKLEGVSSFVQDNTSHSKRNVIRGLHYQLKHPQGKLVFVLSGEIYDVCVDIRHGSPNFGKWIGCHLTASNKRQLFIPCGFAHGFCVLSETADVIYKCTDFYAPDDEYGIHWSDPTVGINWPIQNPILSEKDKAFKYLVDTSEELLPIFEN